MSTERWGDASASTMNEAVKRWAALMGESAVNGRAPVRQGVSVAFERFVCILICALACYRLMPRYFAPGNAHLPSMRSMR